MTRKEAANIALTEIKNGMLEYGEDSIYVASPQPGKIPGLGKKHMKVL